MGNQSSSEQTPSTPQQPSRKERERERSQQRHGKTPSHEHPPRTLTPTFSIPSTSTTSAYAQATVSASPVSTHTRVRSITSATTPSSISPMGNNSSTPSRASTLPPPTSAKPQRSPSSQPVAVPQPPTHDGPNEQDDLTPPTGASPFGLPPSNFSRPPRLPLPIETDPEPSSPIIGPHDDGTAVEEVDMDLEQRNSLLSSTTLDDDESADVEQFALESDPLGQKVPTTLTWKGDAKAVYITGTFAKWNKKFRMHRGQDGYFIATIPLTIGTHHISFLADGEHAISSDLPTTVDFANALINYIEVVPPKATDVEKQPPVPAQPMPIPGATSASGDTKPLDIRTGGRAPEQSSIPQDQFGPVPLVSGQPQPHDVHDLNDLHGQQHAALPKKKIPRPKYTSEIPDVLLHLDLFNTPEDERFRRATKGTQHLPQPPSLPMFMSKSILNATTAHKDDASVLTMPNHTVLNHLATSSIRSGVLATSGTTRYKRKFLTTIMYKPTSGDG